MKSLTKTLAMVVVALLFASSVDQAQAGGGHGGGGHGGGSHGGGSHRGGSHGGGGHGGGGHRGGSHRGGSLHGGNHSSHRISHNGGRHNNRHVIHNYLHNHQYKNFVHYYQGGKTHYLNPYCPVPVIEVERTPVPDGSTLSIPGKWFRSRGHAWMMIADRRFPIRILESTPGALTFQLPHMGVSQPTPARFFLVLPSGLIVEKNYILLTPQALVPALVPVHP